MNFVGIHSSVCRRGEIMDVENIRKAEGNNRERTVLDRRKFLAGSAGAGIGLAALAAGGASLSQFLMGDRSEAAEASSDASRVALVRSEKVFQPGDDGPNAEQVAWMLAAGMGSLFDTENPSEVWRNLFKPDDVVGIKVNCIAAPQLATHPRVVAAIVSELKRASVPEENIIIWDRKNNELQRAGYTLNLDGPGVRCYGTKRKVGYEEKTTTKGSFSGRLSKILTQRITALINVPILKDHGMAGVTISMKNHYGSFHNPRQHHANHGDPYIADLNSIDAIKDKTRLIVCDATRALCNGGPGYKPAFTWRYSGMLVATDPVALDTVGAGIINERREEIGLPTLEDAGRPPLQLASAAERGLGNTEMSRIDLRRLTL
jgi:uncharacterized protein (DUF362 family)